LSRTLTSPRHRALVALIIAERKKAGLTQWDVATKLRRAQSIVSTLESGERRIDVVEFLELAEVIGFDPRKALAQLLKF